MLLKEFEEKIIELFKKAELDIFKATKIQHLEITVNRKHIFFSCSRLINSVFDFKCEAGDLFNKYKKKIMDLLILKKKSLLSKKDNIYKQHYNYTLPGRKIFTGNKHPISQIIEDSVDIFRRIGFIAVDGPIIETPENCFDKLNVDKHHPSRSKHDTFYIKGMKKLLRTHTSSVQIKTMESKEPPLRIISPGICFRRDTVDATHNYMFHQLEGLYIDTKVSLIDLKSTLLYFMRELFGSNVKIRIRNGFFPFTEPSIEYDLICIKCDGFGCNLCNGSGWIEISGAGVVNPKVLKNVGLDPNRWSGFAFGMGIERLAMLKYDIEDIRLLYRNDIRFYNFISKYKKLKISKQTVIK